MRALRYYRGRSHRLLTAGLHSLATQSHVHLNHMLQVTCQCMRILLPICIAQLPNGEEGEGVLSVLGT